MFPYDANVSTIVQEARRLWKRFSAKVGVSCRSNDGQPAISMSAVFNKGFSPLFSIPRSLSPSLPPSLLLAGGAARGPPDAYRQMSLVEQNTLCLTSQAATGL